MHRDEMADHHMRSDVDAVIAALQAVLSDAEARTWKSFWHATVVNRWIDQLPGAWMGRWRQAMLPWLPPGSGPWVRWRFCLCPT